MSKISITSLEARNKAIKGMDYVADAIKSTMGPFGLNFALEKGNKITNDGAKIAAELCTSIENEYERRGALIAQEASAKTNDMVGDFSSGTWALTQAIVKEAIRYLPNEKTIKAKKTPSEVSKMILEAKSDVLAKLEKKVTPITSKEELIKSALVSVEDPEIAELLGSLQWELGPDGVIIAEEVNDTKSSVERVNGIRLDNGFGASMFVTNPEKGSIELDEMSILLTNYTIGQEELKMLNNSVFTVLINQKKRGLILVARAFTSDAIKLCNESMQSGFAIFPINAPYVYQSEIMHDIEAVVGGRYIDVEETRLEDMFVTDVGFVKRLEARQFDAVVTGLDTDESKARITKRVEKLKAKLAGEQSDFQKRIIENRIAQLSSGFGILKVGSPTLGNRKRLFDKCEDAVNAVRHALKGGTVRGAGIAMKEISDTLTEENILKRPLNAIYYQIMSSAPEGWEAPEWVRDPFLVLKCGIENSCDLATTFATIGGQIVEENKPKCKCNHEN